MPACLSVYLTHIMVILSVDPLAVEVQGLEEEDGQAAARPLPSRAAAGSIAASAPGPLLWHDMVHEFYTLGARCMVLARRTTAYMAKPPAGERLLPVDDGCVRLLVSCPTLRMSSPLWAHVNVCRTCSSRVLRHLQLAWQARDAAAGQRSAICGGGEGGGGGGSSSDAGGHGRLGVTDASRELTVLGQTAVSRQLVAAVWDRCAPCVPLAPRVAPHVWLPLMRRRARPLACRAPLPAALSAALCALARG